jgi:glucose-1-phosphate thymidylyltransferase
VAGKPIIDYLLEKGSFPGRPIVSTNRRFASQFEAWQTKSAWAVDLVIEETTREEEKLGTVGALAFLTRELGIEEDLFVIGGDNIFEFSVDALLSAYRGRPLVALCDVGDLETVRGRYGVAVVQDGLIVDFQEKPSHPKSTLASTACYIYPAEVFPLFGAFLHQAKAGFDAPGYFNEWLLREKGYPFDPFVFDEDWYDIGDRVAYIQANQHYAHRDTYIGGNVVVERSTVRDSVILDNVVIRDASISECVVDQGCELVGVTLHACLVKAGSVVKKTP